MTDCSKSPRRLIALGAAMLVAVAVVLVLGVIPPIRSDTFPRAAPGSAAAAFLVQAAMAILLAVALVVVAARAIERPRAARVALHVIGSLAFLLGIVLMGPAPTFRAHGPALHRAILLMFLSAAAEFAATAFVVVAASLLPRSTPGRAVSEDMDAWKIRIAPAAVLGFGSFFLMFLLAKG